jgi:hypothetical protein
MTIPADEMRRLLNTMTTRISSDLPKELDHDQYLVGDLRLMRNRIRDEEPLRVTSEEAAALVRRGLAALNTIDKHLFQLSLRAPTTKEQLEAKEKLEPLTRLRRWAETISRRLSGSELTVATDRRVTPPETIVRSDPRPGTGSSASPPSQENAAESA